MIVREQVPLAAYTTLGLGGPAARFAEAATDADVVAAVRAADHRGEPVLVLGSGSNLVIADEGFDGTVVRVGTRGISEAGGRGRATATVRVAAGEDWDGVVRWAIARGLVRPGVPVRHPRAAAARPRSRTSAPTGRR